MCTIFSNQSWMKQTKFLISPLLKFFWYHYIIITMLVIKILKFISWKKIIKIYYKRIYLQCYRVVIGYFLLYIFCYTTDCDTCGIVCPNKYWQPQGSLKRTQLISNCFIGDDNWSRSRILESVVEWLAGTNTPVDFDFTHAEGCIWNKY